MCSQKTFLHSAPYIGYIFPRELFLFKTCYHNKHLAWGLGQRGEPFLCSLTPGSMSSAVDLLFDKELDYIFKTISLSRNRMTMGSENNLYRLHTQ